VEQLDGTFEECVSIFIKRLDDKVQLLSSRQAMAAEPVFGIRLPLERSEDGMIERFRIFPAGTGRIVTGHVTPRANGRDDISYHGDEREQRSFDAPDLWSLHLQHHPETDVVAHKVGRVLLPSRRPAQVAAVVPRSAA
jgi:hypothetical protein